MRRGSLTAWIFGQKQERCLCSNTVDSARQTNDKTAPSSITAPPDSLIRQGEVIGGRYQLLKLLGQGAYGSVYKAFDQKFDSQVAIKILRLSLLNDDSAVKRFERESQAASALCHPNLVTIHGYGVAENHLPYIVMEFVDGESLDQIIDKTGHLESQRALRILIQCAGGIAHAHSKGVVHRDLKPSNVVVQKDPNGLDSIKVVDFGIAQLNSEITEQPDLTQTGEVFGSPLYMSPAAVQRSQTGQPIRHLFLRMHDV